MVGTPKKCVVLLCGAAFCSCSTTLLYSGKSIIVSQQGNKSDEKESEDLISIQRNSNNFRISGYDIELQGDCVLSCNSDNSDMKSSGSEAEPCRFHFPDEDKLVVFDSVEATERIYATWNHSPNYQWLHTLTIDLLGFTIGAKKEVFNYNFTSVNIVGTGRAEFEKCERVPVGGFSLANPAKSSSASSSTVIPLLISPALPLINHPDGPAKDPLTHREPKEKTELKCTPIEPQRPPDLRSSNIRRKCRRVSTLSAGKAGDRTGVTWGRP